MIKETNTQDLFLGLVLGICCSVVTAIIVSRSMQSYQDQINSQAVVRAYEEGRQAALSTKPPSVELELTCANLWLNKIPTNPALQQ